MLFHYRNLLGFISSGFQPYYRVSHTIMIWLNLLFLFFITLISFATGLQINYGLYHIIFIINALILIITGSLLASIWLHAKKNNLIDKSLSLIQTRNIFLQSLLPRQLHLQFRFLFLLLIFKLPTTFEW